MRLVYLNGTLKHAEDPLISVDERGFRFGDGVFETIPVHMAVPYLWEYHMERLEKGLAALHIQSPLENLLEHSIALIHKNGISDGIIRIYISRGIGSQGYLPSPTSSTPTTLIQTLERHAIPDAPINLWLSSYEKISPNALPTHCKTSQGLNSSLARMEADKHRCYDALQLDRFERIAETSSSNIFWFKDDRLFTPSLACGALAGVTRRRIMDLSPYPVSEGTYILDDIKSAQAVFITNASIGILAIKSLRPLGFSWDSEAIVDKIISLRNQDITNYIKHMRELLA